MQTHTDPQQFYEDSRSSNRYLLAFGLFMLVGLVALAWIGRPPRSSAIGQKLPRLDLQPLLDAQAISNDDFVGKVSVLHFWGTWCGPCQLEFPEFVELAKRFQDRESVSIVGVSCSPGPEYDLAALRDKTRDFLRAYDMPIRMYADSAGMTRHQISLLLPSGSLGYPTTLLVDSQGVIVEAIEGYGPGEMQEIAAKIESML